MARMYARKKGKSGSKKPSKKATWVTHSPQEIEKLYITRPIWNPICSRFHKQNNASDSK